MLTATVIAYSVAALFTVAGLFLLSCIRPTRSRAVETPQTRSDREELISASVDTYGREVA